MSEEGKEKKVFKVVAGSPDRPIKISDLELEAYVLEDGTRVLSERGVLRALGMSPGARDTEERLPRYLRGQNIASLVSPELKEKLTKPLWFKLEKEGGGARKGVPATLLPDICDVWLRGRDAGILIRSQVDTAKMADILIRGLAHVGIIALIDEATGYQKQKNEYQKILELYIAKEMRPWVMTFDENYYKQLYRLLGWDWDAFKSKKKNHSQYIGQLTNRIVYEKLAPGILETLRKINPKDLRGNTKNRNHQFLSENVGYVHLIKHVSAVTTIMEMFPDGAWKDALHKIDTRFPTHQLPEQLALDFSPPADKEKFNGLVKIASQPVESKEETKQ